MPDMFCSADLLGLMESRQGASVHTTVFGQFSFRIYFKEELPQIFRHSCRSYGLESHAHQARVNPFKNNLTDQV